MKHKIMDVRIFLVMLRYELCKILKTIQPVTVKHINTIFVLRSYTQKNFVCRRKNVQNDGGNKIIS